MRLKTRSVRKGIWLAPVMVLGEPSQGFAVWDGHGRRGPFRRLLTYMRPHRKTVRLAAFCSVFNKFWDLAPTSHRFGRGRGRPKRGFNPYGVGLVDPWHQLVALSVLTFIWGWNH